MEELRIDDGKPVDGAQRGQIVSIPVEKKVRKNDMLYKLVPRGFGEIEA